MGDNVPLEEEVVGNGSLAARYRDIVDAVRMRGHCTINDDVIPEWVWVKEEMLSDRTIIRNKNRTREVNATSVVIILQRSIIEFHSPMYALLLILYSVIRVRICSSAV